MSHESISDHDRNRRRYGRSDDELVGYFASAIGVKAQNINSDGGQTDPNERHYRLLRALARGQLSQHDAIRATLAQLPAEQQRLLATLYAPHGAPTWLVDALSPPWGGGSFVQLAASLPRAAMAAQGREEGRTVLDWIAARGRGPKDALLSSLREDCEALRLVVLEAYDALRILRVKAAAQADRERKERKSAQNMALFNKLVARRERKERERRAKRTGIAA